MRRRWCCWDGALKPESNVIGEKSWNIRTFDFGRHGYCCEDNVESAPVCMCHASRVPPGELVTVDVL